MTRPGTGTVSGTYDAQDRLTTYGAVTYSYSANGDLQTATSGGQITTYNYDVFGNLTAVTLPSGTQIEYVIDGQNPGNNLCRRVTAMDWNRVLSLIVAVSYLVGVLVLIGFDGRVFLVLGYLVFFLGCIWYGEEMGDFVGIGSKGIYISSQTPGRLIQFVGWFFLLLPVLAPLIFGME